MKVNFIFHSLQVPGAAGRGPGGQHPGGHQEGGGGAQGGGGGAGPSAKPLDRRQLQHRGHRLQPGRHCHLAERWVAFCLLFTVYIWNGDYVCCSVGHCCCCISALFGVITAHKNHNSISSVPFKLFLSRITITKMLFKITQFSCLCWTKNPTVLAQHVAPRCWHGFFEKTA